MVQSILVISTVTTLVSFSVVLWSLSSSFTLPRTNIVLPGFLFWVALIYAASGTLITHLIGRTLIPLYFQRQHMEADFRFSLARLREYTEQVALLGGETAERNVLGGRFAALIANWLAVISTSAVDERMEAELYAVLARRLNGTTIVSIGHRSAVVALHQRHLEMTPEARLFTLSDAAKALAAGQ
jgi:ABC-type uncharacterized transport system fused permease/ATPase subunit